MCNSQADRKQVLNRIGELRLTLADTDTQIKKLQEFMNKAGIPLQAYQDQGQQSLSAQQLHQKSHEELSGDLIRLQSDYEAL